VEARYLGKKKRNPLEQQTLPVLRIAGFRCFKAFGVCVCVGGGGNLQKFIEYWKSISTLAEFNF
jgi:hypothetical protein